MQQSCDNITKKMELKLKKYFDTAEVWIQYYVHLLIDLPVVILIEGRIGRCHIRRVIEL